MGAKKIKKTIIPPKTRLLLEIALHGVEYESNYLKRLADKIDYSEGSIKSQLLPDLLNSGLIESLSPDKESPPYRVTKDGKDLLSPIFVVRTIGCSIGILLFTLLATLLYFYISRPLLLIQIWLPAAVAGFTACIFPLIYYPQLIMKFGKLSFSKSK